MKARAARVVIGAIALLLVGTQSVAAGTPTIQHSKNVEVTGFVYGSCGSFDLLFDGTVNLLDVVYVDANGTPIREDFQAHFQGILYNSVSGKSLPDSGSLNFETDLLTGVTRTSGVARHDTAPHFGLILLDAGRIVTDAVGNTVFASASLVTPEEFAAACNYFGS